MSDTVTLTFHEGDADGPATVAEIPRRLGHVQLIREVGRGGMGVVWERRDELLRRDVAVKLFHSIALASDVALRRQFIEGARAAAVVKHANVVSVYHADELGELIYVVMEFVDGCTLRDVLVACGRFEPQMAALVTGRVLAAMTAIHDAGVVHRDLKPGNVLFDRRGELLLSDFGLSFQRASATASEETVLGTPPYMAPEMFDGEGSYHSDVYAAAIMYYEMLTGSRPFRAENVGEYRSLHRNAPLPDAPLQHLAPEVCEILTRGTNKKRFFRYKTAAHMLKAVTDAYPEVMTSLPLDRELREMIGEVAGSGPPAAPAGDQPEKLQTSYFDLLSKRADAKRQRKKDH